jgi:hypothetical protein
MRIGSSRQGQSVRLVTGTMRPRKRKFGAEIFSIRRAPGHQPRVGAVWARVLLAVVAMVTTFALARGQARAQGATVQLRGDLPFTAAELEEALALRWRGGDLAVVVTPATADGVAIVVGSATGEVPLQGDVGPAAARRVAVAVVALADAGALPGGLPPAPVEQSWPSLPVEPTVPVAPRLGLSVHAGAATYPLLGGGLTVTTRVDGDVSLVLDADVGRVKGLAGTGQEGDVLAGTLRLGLQGEWPEPWDLPFVVQARYGAVASIYRIDGALDGQPLARTAVVWGGGGAVLLARGSDRWRGVLGLGLDLFVTRERVLAAGRELVATPRMSGWATMGIEVRWP